MFGKQEIKLTHAAALPGKIAGGIFCAALFFAGAALLVVLRTPGTPNSVLLLLVVALYFVSAPYFLVSGKRDEENFGVRLILGFMLILNLIFSLAYSYFDMTVQMNSPNKVVRQIAILAALLYLINENRLLAGKPRNRFYIFSASAAVYLLAVSSIPSIIAFATGLFTDKIYLIFDISMFVLLVYTSISFIRQAFGKNFIRQNAEPESETENNF